MANVCKRIEDELLKGFPHSLWLDGAWALEHISPDWVRDICDVKERDYKAVFIGSSPQHSDCCFCFKYESDLLRFEVEVLDELSYWNQITLPLVQFPRST